MSYRINKKGEIWRNVPQTDGLYQVSNLGRLKMLNPNWMNFSISKLLSNLYLIVDPPIKLVCINGLDHAIPYISYKRGDYRYSSSLVSILFEVFCGIKGLDYFNLLPCDRNFQNLSKSNMLLVNKETFFRMLNLDVSSGFNAGLKLSHLRRFYTVYDADGNKVGIVEKKSELVSSFGLSDSMIAMERSFYCNVNEEIDFLFFRGYGPSKLNVVNNQNLNCDTELVLNGVILNLSESGNAIKVYNKLESKGMKPLLKSIFD